MTFDVFKYSKESEGPVLVVEGHSKEDAKATLRVLLPGEQLRYVVKERK